MAEVQSKTKIKKKRWIALKAPQLFGERIIGETTVLEPKMVIGKKVTTNAMALLGDPKKQHINLSFEAVSLEGNTTAKCDLVGLTIIPSSLKRFIKRNKDKIDDSYMMKTKDEKIIRIKPFIITNSNTNQSVHAQLRRRVYALLVKEAEANTFENLVADILSMRVQKSLRDGLNKIFPVRICEIRIVQIETNKNRIKTFKAPIITEEPPKEEAEEFDEEDSKHVSPNTDTNESTAQVDSEEVIDASDDDSLNKE